MKELLKVFAWTRFVAERGGSLSVYTEAISEVLTSDPDVILTEFLPLTEESSSLLMMLHPDLPLEEIKLAYREWQSYTSPHGKEYHAYYTWFNQEQEWM